MLKTSAAVIFGFISLLAASLARLQPAPQGPGNPAPAGLSGIDTSHSTQVLAGIADLSPTSVAAADLSPQALAALAGYLQPGNTAAQAVWQRMRSWSDANAALGNAATAQGTASDATVRSQYESAVQAEAAAKSAMNAARQNFAQACRTSLSPAAKARLARFRAAEQAGLPVEFGAANLGAAQMSQLRQDLLNERHAARTGRQLHADARARLATIRNNPLVTAAAIRVSERLPSTTTALGM